MSVDRALQGVLDCLSDAQVTALAAACDAAVRPNGSMVHVAVGANPAAQDAVATLAKQWSATPGLTGAGVALGLRTGLAARRQAAQRRARPVWTGPGAKGEQRLTSAVFHELLAGAHERVLLVSYAAYTLQEVANDLLQAVARGCRVDVVFETTTDSDGQYQGPKGPPFASIAGIHRWRWPPDQRTGGGVLHAKLLVVDGRRAFVGSANLTHRALHANLEAGVLVRDGDVAAALEQHITTLITAGTLTSDDP